MSVQPRPVAVALGSNLGDRAHEMATALALVDAIPGLELIAASSLYESAPWGFADQGAFFNSAAIGQWSGESARLLHHLKHIENLRGKRVVCLNGPRVIDLDLLYCGDELSSDPSLLLPHPRMADRPFVYHPLREAHERAGIPLSQVPQPSIAGLDIERDTARLEPEWPFPASAAAASERQLDLESLDATQQLARGLAPLFLAGGTVALDGPLGAGKSELARALIHALGVEGRIPSPTYTLCRNYSSHGLEIEHWDFYRLGDFSELESAGFDSGNTDGRLRVIEWGERFPEALGPSTLHLRIDPTGESSRHLRMSRAVGLPLLARTFSVKVHA